MKNRSIIGAILGTAALSAVLTAGLGPNETVASASAMPQRPQAVVHPFAVYTVPVSKTCTDGNFRIATTTNYSVNNTYVPTRYIALDTTVIQQRFTGVPSRWQDLDWATSANITHWYDGSIIQKWGPTNPSTAKIFKDWTVSYVAHTGEVRVESAFSNSGIGGTPNIRCVNNNPPLG